MSAFPDGDETPGLAVVCQQEPMAGDRNRHCELEQEKYDTHENVKIICLGDSAVGKSKYVRKSGKSKRPQSGPGWMRKVLQRWRECMWFL